jgi:hypothetical protein
MGRRRKNLKIEICTLVFKTSKGQFLKQNYVIVRLTVLSLYIRQTKATDAGKK